MSVSYTHLDVYKRQARACRDVPVTGRISRIILEGLFTTVTNVSFDGDSIREMIRRVQEEKAAIVPDCGGCGAPCGQNNDYGMAGLWYGDEDIRSLKSLILFGIRGMAAYAYHAMVLGYSDAVSYTHLDVYKRQFSF